MDRRHEFRLTDWFTLTALALLVASFIAGGLAGCGRHESENRSFTQAAETHQGQKPSTPAERMADAIQKGMWTEVVAILKEGFTVDERLPMGRTPLIHAAVNTRARIMKILLESGARPDLTDPAGRTALDLVQANGFLRGWIVLDAAKHAQEQANLMKFAKRRSSQKVEELLTAGVDPNFHGEGGETPLTEAIRQIPRFASARNVVLVLARWCDLEDLNPIDLEFADKSGRTPLAIARELSLTDVIETLSRYGAKE